MIGARKGSPLAVGHGDGEMYLGSDAIALAPFTDTITYLDDGDWAVMTHKGVEIRDEKGAVVERAHGQDHRLGGAGRQGQPQAFHGQGNPRAARGRGTYLRALHRHDDGARAAARKAAVRLEEAQPALDLRLRHRVLRRAGGEILVRALCAAVGRNRHRLRVPLPRGAAVAGRSRDLHLAVGRDRGHARHAALRQGAASSTFFPWSTCRPRPSRAKATW